MIRFLKIQAFEVIVQPQNKNTFFEPRTLVAVVLVGIFFFGWQKYLEHKYPDFYKKKDVVAEKAPATAPATAATPVPTGASIQKPVVTSTPETRMPMQVGDVVFEVSSKGMGLRGWTIHDYKDREHQPVQVGISEKFGLYQMGLVDSEQGFDFALKKISENSIQGTAQVGSMTIEQTLTYDIEKASLNSKINVLNPSQDFKGLTLMLPEKKQLQKDGTFFLPSIEHQEFAVYHQGKMERVNASSKTEAIEKNFEQVSLVSIGSQYFMTAILDQSEIVPEVKVHAPMEGELLAQLVYRVSAVKPQMSFQWTGYAGPKDIKKLQQIDPKMGDIVNFGFFSAIGKVLLVTLRWFHSFVGNWGLAIIFLTLLVRLIVLPFNITSYKSMKKMQTIQPMLKSLRERYKDDPTAMNRETMALMREQKVNPLGGCLPMLLQMPVFFALYQVLGQSIELYQAPFFGWIHDLSLKDPFFVLPVLMGVAMFVQQKITPTTMDPAQARILQWMPVIFSVFTLSLPAGLTLYIFISTLFGLIQQQIFMRDSKAKVPVATATAKS